MGRPGRKRKAGARHPSGQLVRKPATRAIDDRVRTSRQPHRRQLTTEARLDERAESPLGMLLLRGLLNRPEENEPKKKSEPSPAAHDRYNAGVMFAQITGSYRVTIGAPRSTAGSGRSSDCDPQLCTIFSDECQCRRTKARYDGAFEALAAAGQRVVKAVSRVAVHGEAIASEEMVNLVDGLDVLVSHFGLTPRRPLRHS